MHLRSYLLSLITFIFLSLGVIGKVHAYATLPWVIDEQAVIKTDVLNGVNHILASTAANRNIHLRVIIVNVNQAQVKEVIHQKMIEYKNKVPYQFQNVTTFLIINLATDQSHIYLGTDIPKTDPMIQNLIHIQKEIIVPALTQKDIVTALTQGSIAMTTVLDSNPKFAKTTSYWQSINKWLQAHNLKLPTQILFGLMILISLWWAIMRYLSRPRFMDEEVDMIALQEQMIFNNLALRQQYGENFLERAP